jgi:type III pantothenate kinase
MNLIVEQGNTTTKVAIYDNKGCMEALQVHKNLKSCTIKSFSRKYDLRQGIMSTVVEPDVELLSFLNNILPHFIFFDEKTPVPINIQYQTPQLLGKDRLAAVVGANYLEPGKNILVIDAGTAITYELIEASGSYIGGNISPGMTTRFKALNHYTSKLPLIHEEEEITQIGYNTKTAIQAGVVNGIIYEMDGFIEDLRRKYPDLLVFLTGGHSFYFERRLKNTTFANINLVLTGLNRILEYNVEN